MFDASKTQFLHLYQALGSQLDSIAKCHHYIYTDVIFVIITN